MHSYKKQKTCLKIIPWNQISMDPKPSKIKLPNRKLQFGSLNMQNGLTYLKKYGIVEYIF